MANTEFELTQPLPLEHLDFLSTILHSRPHDLGILLGEGGDDDALKSSKEASAPLTESACVVRANVGDGVDYEATRRAGG